MIASIFPPQISVSFLHQRSFFISSFAARLHFDYQEDLL